MAKTEIVTCDYPDCESKAALTYYIRQEGGDEFIVDFCQPHSIRLTSVAAYGRPASGRLSLAGQLDGMWWDSDETVGGATDGN